MKKLLLTAVAAFTAVSLYGQGQVLFRNSASTLVFNQFKGANVVLADGIDAGLYWLNPATSAFQLVDTARINQGLGVGAGRYSGGTVDIPGGNPGLSQTFEVRAWEAAFGSTYEAAAAAAPMSIGGGAPRLATLGKSGNFPSMMKDPANPLTTPTDLATAIPGFSVNVVPEPSVVALGLLGVGGLLLLRRRK